MPKSTKDSGPLSPGSCGTKEASIGRGKFAFLCIIVASSNVFVPRSLQRVTPRTQGEYFTAPAVFSHQKGEYELQANQPEIQLTDDEMLEVRQLPHYDITLTVCISYMRLWRKSSIFKPITLLKQSLSEWRNSSRTLKRCCKVGCISWAAVGCILTIYQA